jgi:hypothetical protein
VQSEPSKEIDSCSEPCLLASSIGKSAFMVRAVARIAANGEKFDNQERGQLLSFLFAVTPNRTMRL